MPMYQFKCKGQECQHDFRDLVPMTGPEPPCPRCGGETKKLISAPAFKLEGPGFHVNDYPSE